MPRITDLPQAGTPSASDVMVIVQNGRTRQVNLGSLNLGGGTPGPAGPQGPQGAQGPQGNTGPQGQTGAAGAPGAQGAAGNQGLQGAVGPQGPAGPQGAQGADGQDGAQGPQGPQGIQGQKGDQGDQGPQGLPGAAGATGAQGPQGLTGPQGAQGPQGLPGNDGAKGDDGAQGPAGIQGPQGAPGPQGATGAQGAKGDKGDQGDQGPQGIAGQVGPQGPKGDTGAQGAQGPAGTPGAAGAQGAKGDAGAQGPAGQVGAQGPAGVTGAQGPAGPQGDVGPQGVAGPKGDQGDQGPAGPQGPQGVAGAKGDQGLPGRDGAAGAQGAQGATGAQGPAGPQGPIGPMNPITVVPTQLIGNGTPGNALGIDLDAEASRIFNQINDAVQPGNLLNKTTNFPNETITLNVDGAQLNTIINAEIASYGGPLDPNAQSPSIEGDITVNQNTGKFQIGRAVGDNEAGNYQVLTWVPDSVNPLTGKWQPFTVGGAGGLAYIEVQQTGQQNPINANDLVFQNTATSPDVQLTVTPSVQYPNVGAATFNFGLPRFYDGFGQRPSGRVILSNIQDITLDVWGRVVDYTVFGNAPQITMISISNGTATPSSSAKVRVGDTALVSWTVTGGTPPFTYQIFDNNNNDVTNTGTLVGTTWTTPPMPSMVVTRTFRVVATDSQSPGRTANSSPVTFQPYNAPTFPTQPFILSPVGQINVGSTVVFSWDAQSDPDLPSPINLTFVVNDSGTSQPPQVTENYTILNIQTTRTISVIATDASGRSTQSTAVTANLAGVSTLAITTANWMQIPAFGPATDAMYWDGTASVPNQKNLAVTWTWTGQPIDVANPFVSATITPAGGSAIDIADILTANLASLNFNQNSMTIPASVFVNNPTLAPVLTNTVAQSLALSFRLTNAATTNTAMRNLSPVLIAPVPFAVSGTLTATPSSSTTNAPFYNPAPGSVAVGGLMVAGGNVTSAVFTLLQGGMQVQQVTQSNLNPLTFMNVPVVGVGDMPYEVTADITGAGTNGANPTPPDIVPTPVMNVNVMAGPTYTPIFGPYMTSAPFIPPNPTVPIVLTADNAAAQPQSTFGYLASDNTRNRVTATSPRNNQWAWIAIPIASPTQTVSVRPNGTTWSCFYVTPLGNAYRLISRSETNYFDATVQIEGQWYRWIGTAGSGTSTPIMQGYGVDGLTS